MFLFLLRVSWFGCEYFWLKQQLIAVWLSASLASG